MDTKLKSSNSQKLVRAFTVVIAIIAIVIGVFNGITIVSSASVMGPSVLDKNATLYDCPDFQKEIRSDVSNIVAWSNRNYMEKQIKKAQQDCVDSVLGGYIYAKDYYDKLKSKFHGMDFILVSKDMKSQVAANAAAYGNANKPVVLIDDEKLERMATDEAYRKKYEGIIAMSQIKLQEAKNSLVSSGANVKNFGMSVSSDGKTSFFATIEKANEQQAKILEKKQAEKKAAKLKEKKKAEKEAIKERLEKLKENKNEGKIEAQTENKAEDETESSLEGIIENKEYVEFKSDSVDALVSMVAKYAYANSLESVMTESESKVGQNIDFRG